MTLAFVAAWARAFLVTQLIEAPIYRYGYGAPVRAALMASTVTHPIVWFVFFGPFEPISHWSYHQRMASAELFAWLVEAALLSLWTGRRHALAWAFLANASSVLIGSAMRATLGFP